MLKFLIKIWPALIPIATYFLWSYVIEKLIQKITKNSAKNKQIIQGEYEVVGEKKTSQGQKTQKIPNFSLKNPKFIITLYISLILAIASLIYSAFK